jgi:serine phosphatase RsbU (regulator of sigma subunit)
MRALITLHQEGAERTVEIREAATLGRGPHADVRIEEPTVSRRHAELRFDEQRWWLRDLGSRNGTLRNGEAVTAIAVPLENGDRLQFGRLQASFHLVQEPSPAEPALPPRASQLYQRMLGTTRLLCDLSVLAAQCGGDAEDFAERCGERLQRSRPGLSRIAILEPVRIGGAWAERFRHPLEAPALPEPLRQAIAAEAAEQPGGFLALETEARQAFADRHRLAEASRAATPWAAFPMRIAGELLGALYVEGAAGGQGLDPSDRDVWLAIAALFASAFALREPPAQAHKWRRARRLQESFLPSAPPVIPGYRFAELCQTAGHLSHELHDQLSLGDGRPLTVLARVQAEGIAGALLAARIGAYLRREATASRSPNELLATLNRLLLREIDPEWSVAMLAFALDPPRGSFELAAAGHVPPFLRRALDGQVETLEYPPKPPLGLDPTARFPNLGGSLREGDLLLLYSAGLLEGASGEGERFGAARVLALLAQHPHAPALIEALRRALVAHVGDSPRATDLTAIAIEREY